VTLWYYGQVGAAQMLTSSLWDGSSLLGSSSFNAWQSLGWHSFTLSQTPSASALAQLRLALRTDGTAGWPTTTKLYAAYLAIDVPGTTAAPAAPASPEAAPAPDAPAAAAAPAETRPVTLPPGAAALGKVPAAVAPGVGITSPATIELPAQPRSVPVELSCAAGAAGSCTGHVRIELLGAAPAKRSQARAARCARGCRVIGEAKFDIAAGKRKPIKIAMRPTAVRLLPRGRSVRALLTVTSRDRTHAATTTTRVITLSRSLK
jgi:hypothetical protein